MRSAFNCFVPKRLFSPEDTSSIREKAGRGTSNALTRTETDTNERGCSCAAGFWFVLTLSLFTRRWPYLPNRQRTSHVRYIVLFNDMLIYCKYGGTLIKSIKYVHVVDVCTSCHAILCLLAVVLHLHLCRTI